MDTYGMEKNKHAANKYIKNIEMKSWHDIKHISHVEHSLGATLMLSLPLPLLLLMMLMLMLFDTHTNGTIAIITRTCVYE